MDPLPGELESLLVEIAPHDGEAEYLADRFSRCGSEVASREVEMLYALDQEGMIDTIGESREMFWPSTENGRGYQSGITFTSGFALTFKGYSYLRGRKKIRRAARAKTLLDVVAFLGSVAAIVNLILYVIWR